LSERRVTMNTTTDLCTFRPEGELTIYTAAGNKEQLLSLLTQCRKLDMDLSRVSEMDTAGLQLLLMAKRESRKRGLPLTVTASSSIVRNVMDTVNAAAYFDEPTTPSEPGVSGNP
jgi:anti-anti-sigma factor